MYVCMYACVLYVCMYVCVSQDLIVASRDLTARVYHRVRSRKMATTVLSGHRGPLVGAFFALVPPPLTYQYMHTYIT